MSKITAIIIALNEEKMIEDCIKSILFCDEIILIDNGSTDKTVEIARKHGARVYDFTGDDFSKIREFGMSKVKSGYIFYIDADERVSSELKASITQAINSTSKKITAYRVIRENYYYGKHKWPVTENLERLFMKSKLTGWSGVLHETAKYEGEIATLDGVLIHYTHQNLSNMVDKTNKWSEKEACLRLNTNHPKMAAWRFIRVMSGAFYDSYVKQKGYKAGTTGVVEGMYQAFSIFITYAKLWEMQNTRK